MKKVISLALVAGAVASANAAIIYSSTVQTGSRVNANNPGFLAVTDPGSQTRINFDDVNISAATMGANTALKLNSVTVGIRRGQGALQNNVRVYASAVAANGNVVGSPILLGNQVLAARTAAGFVTELVTISSLTQTIGMQTGFAVGFSTLLIGVALDADTTAGSSGWRITSGTGPNAGGFANAYETATSTNFAYSFGAAPNPPATFYIELDATPVPEPGSAIALVAGLGALVLRRKKA
ncbi:MAG: PEP-CTERM sorting domain-containing protein [Chthonomonas sp.]|nr:PEP-CTERM sorting domain-containing protein [Chthonomonas sp.]